MSKQHSKEYLSDKKAKKIIEFMIDRMAFQKIMEGIMKENRSGQSQLITSEMSEILLAEKFWKEMRAHAEKFIFDNQHLKK